MEGPPSAAAGDWSWYFAYGSNLSKGRMKQRTGSAPRAQAARLPGYRLAFNLHADAAMFANIVPCEGAIVWGAVYRLRRAMVDALDRYEGVALGHYLRKTIEVELSSGGCVRAEVYVGGEHFLAEEGRPSSAYLRVILTGASEHRLPDLLEARAMQCQE